MPLLCRDPTPIATGMVGFAPMLDPVGSTSWRNRHLPAFQQLGKRLVAEGPVHPIVAIVGPGGVTWLASWFLNNSAAESGPIRKLIGDAARYLDQVLRRIPGMPLVSLEPLEVEQSIRAPHDLIVVDRSRRILNAVARRLPTAECLQLDIGATPLPRSVDVVIAFNVICRLENPAAGMRHVCGSLQPGGLLLVDDRSAKASLDESEFERVAPKTWRRRQPSPAMTD